MIAPTQPGTQPARRGWLIAALAVAVAVLLGSFIAVAAWTGAPGGGTRLERPGMGPGMSQFRHDDRGPGMMDEDRCDERPDGWSDRGERGCR